MLNYLKKFAVDIFPSVAATVIGAYIVNHYIVSKPRTDVPAVAVSAADPKGGGKAAARSTPDGKPAETAAEVSNLPAAGVKARGISEKALMEKTAAERPTVVEKPQEKAQEKPQEKPREKPQEKAEAKADSRNADGPVETASIPAEPRGKQVAPREKEKIRVVLPSPVQPVAPAAAQVAAAPAAVDTTPDERRDANDLARAAIERLRGNADSSPRAPEAARASEVPRAVAAPPVVAPAPPLVAPALRPLPPPIMVSVPPAGESHGQAATPARPPYAANVEAGNPDRPTPPAEIPLSRPLDLRAEVAEPSVRERSTAVAEDVLSTAKSLFHAVLPK
jgi:hypothetical protein